MATLVNEMGLTAVVALAFAAVNIPLLHFIVDKIYNLPGTRMKTATLVIGVVTGIYSLLSFFLFIPYLRGVSFLLTMGAFFILLKRSYHINWPKTALVWLVWVGAFVFQGMVIVLALTPFL